MEIDKIISWWSWGRFETTIPENKSFLAVLYFRKYLKINARVFDTSLLAFYVQTLHN
jgi:hypothetical protein